ncbi:MAG TPA: hypothetical protein VMJ52_14230 [Xanthobacteraceae bacterium]|nr:hypothetical protein [Xanthobacteraceae bacterium]
MRSHDARWPLASMLIGLALLLAACGHRNVEPGYGGYEGTGAYPTNYKSEILGAMHAYLNDPTGIRDAAISEPMQKTVANFQRSVVCVRFNGKQNGSNTYAGVKEFAAVFLAGHFDQFIEKSADLCAGVIYSPFPELEKLPR